jgi:hypothetical protein
MYSIFDKVRPPGNRFEKGKEQCQRKGVDLKSTREGKKKNGQRERDLYATDSRSVDYIRTVQCERSAVGRRPSTTPHSPPQCAFFPAKKMRTIIYVIHDFKNVENSICK